MTYIKKFVIILKLHKDKINSGCSAVGDVSERTLWVIKRGIRSGSDLPSDEPCEVRGLVTTGSAADNCKQKTKFNISGCSAVGSARALGARHRHIVIRFRKTPKSLVNTDFLSNIFSLKFFKNNGLTTCLNTYGKTEKNQHFTYLGM